MTATLLTNRAVIRLSGEDVRGFLQGLVTHDVGKDLPVWAALLTPQGNDGHAALADRAAALAYRALIAQTSPPFVYGAGASPRHRRA